MEYRCHDIFAGDMAAQQGLDVGFGKNTAPGRDRIDIRGFCGHSVKLRHIDTQKNRHLVYKSAGSSGATPVHPDIGAATVVEEYYFGVFTSDFDECPHFREKLFDEARRGNDFLDKGQPEEFGYAHPAEPVTARSSSTSPSSRKTSLKLSLVVSTVLPDGDSNGKHDAAFPSRTATLVVVEPMSIPVK